jgi:hypothetical protein
VRFILFVEGHTERSGIDKFLKRYLDPPRLKERVGITCIRFGGWSDLVKDLKKIARLHLNDPKHRDQTIGLAALLDLYGPYVYPADRKTAIQRVSWAKKHFENEVDHPRFRMFFAVHEVEAWFLSDPSLFPDKVRQAIRSKARNPEDVNFTHPPKALLKKLYREKMKREYKEVTQGHEFFSRLDPATAAAACPNLRAMLDEMVSLAKEAGL